MTPHPITLIGAPTDVGAADRGASMGPEALRVAGLREALMARGFAQEAGGALRLARREPSGSTAELWLPAAAA